MCTLSWLSIFQEDQTDSSSCDSDRTENCFSDRGHVTRVMSRDRDVMSRDRDIMSRDRDKKHEVTDLHQILGHEAEARGIVPVYWSASQLLSKLDHRQPIRSEYRMTNERPEYGATNPGGEQRQQRQHHQQPYDTNRSEHVTCKYQSSHGLNNQRPPVDFKYN